MNPHTFLKSGIIVNKGLPALLLWISCLGCNSHSERSTPSFYMGVDLSFVNEMMDCGAVYRENGQPVNPYELFGKKGVNISRIRLWHNPKYWTDYSDYEDVALAIKRSKSAGMAVLLDIHYSDIWVDPNRQLIPKAWEHVSDVTVLADSMYKYTYQTLASLYAEGLTPEFVQVGNEVNIEIMQDSAHMNVDAINWERNTKLLETGLRAVSDFSLHNGVAIERMIHIAQPENALRWFAEAKQNGLVNYEWIGLSYYPKWSVYDPDSLAIAIDSLRTTYEKKVMIVETAYPYTLEDIDEAENILGEEALVSGYPATKKGQFLFLKKLIEVTKKSGGMGVIYWESAWVSSSCSTRWGRGSHWDNATFFDAANGNEVLPIIDLFSDNSVIK